MVEGTPLQVPVETCDVVYDLCKIDVEGAELQVLKGMKHKGMIVCEFRPKGFSRMGTTSESFLTELEKLGFQITTLKGEKLSHEALIAKAGRHFLNLLLKPAHI